MKIEIDKNSGYCFGVEYSIEMAEEELNDQGKLFCLGDIVHNQMEVERLTTKGLTIIDHEQLRELRDCKVLIRAHGEPSGTYQIAIKNNIELIDASCPVVLKLQNRIKASFDKMEEEGGQVVIYGKLGHAEIQGLTGQTKEKAIVVMEDEDLERIDFNRPISFYSQTTKSTKGFYRLKAMIEERISKANKSADKSLAIANFKANDSICRQVSNREPDMERFSQKHDVILFVSGKKSSNGKALYGVCKNFNDKSYFISNEEEIKRNWVGVGDSIGICGATSTPTWLMERVKNRIENQFQAPKKQSPRANPQIPKKV